MDRLWTPWRYQYVTKSLPGSSSGCIFCEKTADPDDRANFVVHRGERNIVLLNIYPYNNGHVMIAPRQHAATLGDLSAEAAREMMDLTRHCEQLLRAVYRPDGINLGMNIGECAGAGVAGHIHMHVLPRWAGDAGFITTVSETRVVPEDLETTWRRLREAW
jgi:ATP adenylyltransferase